MHLGVRIHAKEGTVDTYDEITVAYYYLNILNEQLANAGWDRNSIKYKSHRIENNEFRFEATAPRGLEEWICCLKYFSGIKIHKDEIIFTLKVPLQDSQLNNDPQTESVKKSTHRRISATI